VRVRVLLFGALRETVGEKELSVSLPDGSRLAELRALLARDHAAFDRYGARLLAAVNHEAAAPEAALCDGDEVAFLPPVSGGAASARRCTLSDRPLDVGEVTARVTGPDAGGVVIFVGAVRDASRGHPIRHLEYEAYAGMAEREMEKICEAAARRWPGVRVAIAHRAGHLEIGDLAVVIAAAAPHRPEAFEACRFAIDTLKQTVPIWKKEVATDGAWWVEDHA
jgi:molybdopterin synthase catalytic subunit